MSKLVITGCGRSGTAYTATVLRRCGVRSSHEAVFRPMMTSIEWGDYDADCSWIAVPWLSTISSRSRVLHQVRNPIDCARSFMGIRFFHPDPPLFRRPYIDTIRGFAPGVFAARMPITRFLLYWVAWNKAAEQYAEFTYRVEDVDAGLLTEMLSGVGITADATVIQGAVQTSKLINHRSRDQTIDWATLPAVSALNPFLELAERYGYTPESSSASSLESTNE